MEQQSSELAHTHTHTHLTSESVMTAGTTKWSGYVGTTPCDRLWKSLHGGGSSFALPVLEVGGGGAAVFVSRPAPDRAGLNLRQKNREERKRGRRKDNKLRIIHENERER